MYLQISLYSSTLRVQVSFAINLSGPKLTPCVVILINMFGQIPAEKIKTHYGLHKLKTLFKCFLHELHSTYSIS